MDRTARLSGPSGNAKVRDASTPQPPPAPLSVPIRSLRDRPRSRRKCRRDLRDRRRSLHKSPTHHRGIPSCPRNAPILPPRALAAILNARLKLIHYPRIQAAEKSGRRTGKPRGGLGSSPGNSNWTEFPTSSRGVAVRKPARGDPLHRLRGAAPLNISGSPSRYKTCVRRRSGGAWPSPSPLSSRPSVWGNWSRHARRRAPFGHAETAHPGSTG